jgi:hypothetical protein
MLCKKKGVKNFQFFFQSLTGNTKSLRKTEKMSTFFFLVLFLVKKALNFEKSI